MKDKEEVMNDVAGRNYVEGVGNKIFSNAETDDALGTANVYAF